MPNETCPACNEQIPQDLSFQILEYERLTLPQRALTWRGKKSRKLARNIEDIIEGDRDLDFYLNHLGDLVDQTVGIRDILPPFQRDPEYCSHFVIPLTDYSLCIKKSFPQERARFRQYHLVELWGEPVNMGIALGGVHLHRVAILGKMLTDQDLPTHL